MIDQDTAVTELRSKSSHLRRNAGKVAYYGIFAAGCLLLVDDVVKKVTKRRSKTTQSTEN
jgi:hypothetical protein